MPDPQTGWTATHSSWLLGALVIGALVLGAGPRLASLIPAGVAVIRDLGPLAPVLFILVYVVAVVAFVPASFLTMAAGALFGLGRGIAYDLAGATLGATAAFLLSRHVAREAFARRLAGHPTLAALDSALGSDGLRITFLLRLSPLVPFGLLNYALGLSRVRLRDFLLASVGMIPGTILYAYSGYLAGDLATLATQGGQTRGAAQAWMMIAGLLATIAVTVLVTRRARQALAAATLERAR